jgi:putative two-component system response regulator
MSRASAANRYMVEEGWLPVDDRGATILIVDDEPANVILLERLLGRIGYSSIHSTTDSREVLTLCETLSPDIVLLDLRMPYLDGFEVLKQLEPFTGGGQFLPVVALTGDPSEAAKDRALNAGAVDFLAKPLSMTEVLLRVRNLLRARRMHLELRSRNMALQEEVIEKTRDLNAAQQEILERLAQAVEFRDEKTGEHTHRVGDYAGRLAAALSLPEDQVELICRAAPLHDVGKVGLPDAILLKPGPLTQQEFEIVKTHTVIGARLLSGSRSPLLQCAEVIALGHHERWDGSGYPHGLSGESIPLPARIVAVVDFFDALTHDRPYRKAWASEKVLRSIEDLSGTHFDPRVAAAFLNEFGRLAG